MIVAEDRITLDQEIASKLRNENPEQFVTLVRMHLSFELDLNTDENDLAHIEKNKNKKWKGFHKKAKGCTSSKSTSPEILKSILSDQNIEDVRQLIQFLVQDENIVQEGIFRKTGSVARQNELKSFLVQGVSINLDKGDYTAHDCASVLKSFLADLSEPLLTEMYYPAYCQVADFCNSKDSAAVKEDRLLHSIQLLFLLLPKENGVLLRNIIEMLHKTIQYENTNKMSAENLATLFTPHLICPRKLTPEALHATAQQMSNIIGFMIKKGSKLFYIPPKLATDIRAYFVELKRRKTMSPEHILNESTTSDSTANTVYTFVDREKTAEATIMNSTDTALAQLYAHIQSLPESSKKKKLIKQFNKENGHGTPLQLLMHRDKHSSSGVKNGGKSFGDSIKKHIFHKGLSSKTPKRTAMQHSFHTPNGTLANPKTRVLFQSPLLNSPNPVCHKSMSSSSSTPIIYRSNSNSSELSSESYKNNDDGRQLKDIIEADDDIMQDGLELVDTDDEDGELYYNHGDSKSKYKSEPNLSCIDRDHDVSTSIKDTPNKKSFLKNKLIKGVSMGNLRFPFGGHENKSIKKSAAMLLKCCFEENLKNINKKANIFAATSLDDSQSPLLSRTLYAEENNAMQNDNFVTMDSNNWNIGYLTSTPSINGRNSMSPITKSTQRMPKSMQESIMTPRSRKPVMMFGGANLGGSDQQQSVYTNQNSFSSLKEEDEDESMAASTIDNDNLMYRSKSESDLKKMLNDTGLPPCPMDNNYVQNSNSQDEEDSNSLTSTFREYLLSRSVMTESPADLSFSSQPDDFDSSTDVRDLSESEMSESLLFCMNGNKPAEELAIASDIFNMRKRHAAEMSSMNIEDKQVIKKMVLQNRTELDETSL